MKNVIWLLLLGSLMLGAGCASIRVESTPRGAAVYRSDEMLGESLLPRTDDPGVYVGRTPCAYWQDSLYFMNLRLVWPDGTETGWQQRRQFRFVHDVHLLFARSDYATNSLSRP